MHIADHFAHAIVICALLAFWLFSSLLALCVLHFLAEGKLTINPPLLLYSNWIESILLTVWVIFIKDFLLKLAYVSILCCRPVSHFESVIST